MASSKILSLILILNSEAFKVLMGRSLGKLSFFLSSAVSSAFCLTTLLGPALVSSFNLYSVSLELGCSNFHLTRVTCRVVSLLYL